MSRLFGRRYRRLLEEIMVHKPFICDWSTQDNIQFEELWYWRSQIVYKLLQIGFVSWRL